MSFYNKNNFFEVDRRSSLSWRLQQISTSGWELLRTCKFSPPSPLSQVSVPLTWQIVTSRAVPARAPLWQPFSAGLVGDEWLRDLLVFLSPQDGRAITFVSARRRSGYKSSSLISASSASLASRSGPRSSRKPWPLRVTWPPPPIWGAADGGGGGRGRRESASAATISKSAQTLLGSLGASVSARRDFHMRGSNVFYFTYLSWCKWDAFHWYSYGGTPKPKQNF